MAVTQVRMKVSIEGTHVNDPRGCKRGDIIDLPPSLVDKYLAAGLCERNLKGEIGVPHQPST